MQQDIAQHDSMLMNLGSELQSKAQQVISQLGSDLLANKQEVTSMIQSMMNNHP